MISFLRLGVGFAFSLTGFLVEAFGFLIAFFANFSVISRFCVLDKFPVQLYLMLARVNQLYKLETAKTAKRAILLR